MPERNEDRPEATTRGKELNSSGVRHFVEGALEQHLLTLGIESDLVSVSLEEGEQAEKGVVELKLTVSSRDGEVLSQEQKLAFFTTFALSNQLDSLLAKELLGVKAFLVTTFTDNEMSIVFEVVESEAGEKKSQLQQLVDERLNLDEEEQRIWEAAEKNKANQMNAEQSILSKLREAIIKSNLIKGVNTIMGNLVSSRRTEVGVTIQKKNQRFIGFRISIYLYDGPALVNQNSINGKVGEIQNLIEDLLETAGISAELLGDPDVFSAQKYTSDIHQDVIFTSRVK
jgi:hypothetical protein